MIIRPKLKAHIVRARHLVARVELQPFSAGADSVRFALIRTHSAILGACQRCRTDHEEQKSGSCREPGTDCFTKYTRYFQDVLQDKSLPHIITEPRSCRKVVCKCS